MTSIPMLIDRAAASGIVAALGYATLKGLILEHRETIERKPWGPDGWDHFSITASISIVGGAMAILFSAIWL